jgi:ABC-2 type transport system permease protein
MKQLVFDYIYERLAVLKVGVVYTFQQETAYWTNNWTSLLSTFFYTVSVILFVDVIYGNVDLVAGYSRNEMLLFVFNGQIGFYTGWVLIKNLQELSANVNKGNLDLLLVRPIPSLFYVTFRKIKAYSLIRDSLPPMLALAIALNWPALNLNTFNVLAGIVIIFLGVTSAHVMHFLATIPVFWLGESSELIDLSFDSEHNIGKIIPFEGYSHEFQFLFSVILPYAITAGFSTSVMLGKSDPLIMLIASFAIAIVFLVLRQIAWKKALRAYTSASS